MKQKASAEEVGSKVGHIRETKKGDLLIELQKGANSEEVSGAIRGAVGDQLLVRPLLPTVTMELRELEDGTTIQEVQEAVGASLGEVNPAQIEVKSLRKGPRGTQVALVLAPRAIASAKILKPGKVRVGWVFARTSEKRMVPRCFKCLGHIAIECPKEEVTEKLCLRFGEPGHLVATCQGQEKCILRGTTGS